MAGFRDMFRGEMLYYNLFVYSLLPIMALFFVLDFITVIIFIVGYVFAFGFWMNSRELKKRKSKEGQEHFDTRLFRSKDFCEEIVLSFKKKHEINLQNIDQLNVEGTNAYKNAKMFVLKTESEQNNEIEQFENEQKKEKKKTKKKNEGIKA
jgi:hypothetical protein